MIVEALSEVRTATGNTKLGNDIHQISTKHCITFWMHSVDKQNSQSETRDEGGRKDYGHLGMHKYNLLELEDALRAFQNLGKDQKDEYLHQRAEINLLIGRSAEALSLAEKGLRLYQSSAAWYDLAFCAAISNKEYDIAAKYIHGMVAMFDSDAPFKNSVVSAWDALHLIFIVCFTTMTCEDTRKFVDLIPTKTSYEIGEFLEIANLFASRNFVEFLSHMEIIKNVLDMSIYTCNIVEDAMKRIVENIMSNIVRPYSKISFEVIARNMPGVMPSEMIPVLLRKLIRRGDVKGKIDLIDNVFIGTSESEQSRELEELFMKTLVIKQSFEQALWREDYKSYYKQVQKK